MKSLKLSLRDAWLFLDALMNPPKPNKALKKAMKKHKRVKKAKK
jgi:uncharacterized protein (DUF1778 family)